jgi:fibrillarin-like pre-rRNA processing protein
MRRSVPFVRCTENPRLLRRAEEGRSSYWTVSLAAGPSPLATERWLARPEGTLRRFDPTRSKLAAGLLRGGERALPHEGERWLYLGAATGTTASHVADLLGERGRLFAVEKSARSFARLLEVAERYPNLFPILADARRPLDYLGLVPPVDGLYADVAQPDQVAIVRANAEEFLRVGGTLLFALKTASMGRERSAREHLAEAERGLRGAFELAPAIDLEPFHRKHFLLRGTGGRALAGAAGSAPPARGRR